MNPLLDDLGCWLYVTLPLESDTAVAPRYSLRLRLALNSYADDSRIEIDNSAAERELRGVASRRPNFLFAGVDKGSERAAAMYVLIGTA